MRGRNAKRLRREAAGRTIGAPLRAYAVTTRERLVAYHPDGACFRGSDEPVGVAVQPGKLVRIVTGVVELAPGCTRAVYQRLKRAA